MLHLLLFGHSPQRPTDLLLQSLCNNTSTVANFGLFFKQFACRPTRDTVTEEELQIFALDPDT